MQKREENETSDSPQKGSFEAHFRDRERRKQEWRKKHADPLFGLPDDDYGGEVMYWSFSKVTFRHARTSTITVSTLGPPSQEYRDIFLWLEKEILAIHRLIPNLLISEATPERDFEYYGEADPERTASAFVPANIFKIAFRNTSPVSWDVHAHHPTDQDVYVTIEGSDEVVIRAFLSM